MKKLFPVVAAVLVMSSGAVSAGSATAAPVGPDPMPAVRYESNVAPSGTRPLAPLESQLFATFDPPSAEEKAARAGLPRQVKEALLRVKGGQVSKEDRAILSSELEYTQLADALSQRVTVGLSQADTPPSNSLTAGTYCRGFAGWVDSKSWISGAWLYQWAQRLDVCYNGSAVTSLNSRYHTVSHRDWAWKDQGLLSDSAGTVGGWQYQSYMRGHMELCVVKFGCATDQYPWVRITAYGNGTAAISSGK